MIDLYQRPDYTSCTGYSYLNAILLLLLREDMPFFISMQRDDINRLKECLLIILKQPEGSVCASVTTLSGCFRSGVSRLFVSWLSSR